MHQATTRRAQRGLWIAIGMLACCGSVAVARAATAPRVEFDTTYSVECLDVTPADFAARYPTSRIVEARFKISTWLTAGRELDLNDLVVEITSSEQTLPVVDFMPRTELDTNIAGEIEVVQSEEKSKTSNAGVGGTVGVEYGIVKAQANPSAGGGRSQVASTKETYKRLPPKQLLLASGTINRGYGVYFKLKPSAQESLEGVREFAVLFLVPSDWRGEAVEVSCTARAGKKSYFSHSIEECGVRTFHVGLYREGDTVARTVAEELARAQGRQPDADPEHGGEFSWTAFKPLVSQAVQGSRSLFLCPLPSKHDQSTGARERTHSQRVVAGSGQTFEKALRSAQATNDE